MNSAVSAALLSAGKALLREAKEAAAAPSERPAGWELLGTYRVLSGPVNGIYRVAIPADNPIRLRHGDTDIVVPYAEMDADFGRIPNWCQAIAGRTPLAYPSSTLFYDEICAAGWCWVVREKRAVRADLQKPEADAALVIALKCERAVGADMLAYSAAVRRYGEEAWRESRRHPVDYPVLFEAEDNGRI